MISTEIKNVLVNRLMQNFKINEIILFGSYAGETHNVDSDIDLIVVLDEKEHSNNYDDRLNRRLSVSKLFWDLKKEIPIDILVYTTGEWNILLSQNSSFIREITHKGIKII